VSGPGERDTAEWYRAFAEVETRGRSAIYEGWALGVADDAEVLALIDELPLQKRQPNLIFACARLLGAAEGGFPAFRRWLVRNFDAVAAEAMRRSTQTNEAGRCASLLPALAALPGPLALLEIGASAGLCLYPDRYSYSYNGGAPIDPPDGRSPVLLESTTTGTMPVPSVLPRVIWRSGIDLRPLNVRNAEDVRWLETLVWPEQTERRERLRAAIGIVTADPPHIAQGDAIDLLAGVARDAPADATLVVITSAVLVYLPFAKRMRLVESILRLDANWISLEGAGGLPVVREQLPADGGPGGRFVLALDQRPLAYTGAHGQNLDWL
jgi:hypothetical protein